VVLSDSMVTMTPNLAAAVDGPKRLAALSSPLALKMNLDKMPSMMYSWMYILGGAEMKTIAFTDFRKRASDLITEVEHGETLVLLRRGKPVAEVVPFSDTAQRTPAWKQSGICLRIRGSDLSSAILEERETAA